tara:strand:- start:11888 stop:13120 length:1233 start_codon:yes stop_codon:yes gene_type:complete
MKILSLFLIVFLSASAGANDFYDWYKEQRQISMQRLLDNISRHDTPRGFVVASPSKYDPDYYYHWVRDAALVMRALDKNLEYGKLKLSLFHDYIMLVRHHQNVYSLTGLGEPKFNADGTSYQGPWGRPQNDGPALRSITLIHYALQLLEQGEKDYVVKYLYANRLPAQGVIKKDLEYVSHNWYHHDFDLWEEVKGHHFYTRMVQRTALVLGAHLARKLNDEGAARWYLEQAKIINEKLDAHYSKEKGYILTTLDRVGGLDYKYSNLDASVILAVNHAWLPGMSFGPTDARVVQTYNALVNAFQRVYPINHHGYPGVAIGRYPEDRYFGGNPWFLLTNGMAEYLNLYAQVVEKDKPDLARRLRSDAILYLKRSRLHMGEDGNMAEQYDKYNGYMLGAKDLTWSYASFLTVE